MVQLRHTLAPARPLKVPGKHDKHVDIPSDGVKEPAAHADEAFDPDPPTKKPADALTHVVRARDGPNVPGSHNRHADALTNALKEPNEQLINMGDARGQ